MKKHEGNMKKYFGNIIMENKDSPYIWAVGLRKIPSSLLYLWASLGDGAGSQFPGLDKPQKKDMKHVKNKIF